MILIIRTYLIHNYYIFFFFYSSDDQDGQKGWCNKPTKSKFQSIFTRKILMLSKRNESTEVYCRTWLHVLRFTFNSKKCVDNFRMVLVFCRVFSIKIVFNKFKLVYNWIFLVIKIIIHLYFFPFTVIIYSSEYFQVKVKGRKRRRKSRRTHRVSSLNFSGKLHMDTLRYVH